MKFSSLLAGSALIASALAVDVDPIVIKGKKFFYKTNGTEFFMRGVAYQQDISTNGTASGSNSTEYQDPLADATACKRDIPLMKELQTNVIRVYAVNPDSDHTECMNLLMENGIYVVSDLSEPSTSINREDPKWNVDLYNRYTSVIDELQQYNNVIGFFAGNEVSNTMSNTNASAFVKAAVRDMKAYIKQKNYRSMGVGYATNDDKDIRVDLANYFNCGTEDDSIDFWGYNVYSWCGKSTYAESGYKDRTEELTDYSIPAFFAEYGCNEVQPRLFTEVQALFGSEMTPVWSGGIVYMWFQEANDYGLVSISNGEASKLTDFENLSTEMASATPTGVNSASYTPTATALQSCPAVASGAWSASSDLPPTPNEALCGCMYDSLSCVVKDSVSSSDYGDLFGTVCGYASAVPGVCDGINANGTSGKYGAYSMCQTKEQIAWILDVYYKAQKAKGNAASACDFGGSATLKSATSATASCSSLLQQAGSAGTGTVTSAPTGTGSSGSSGSSGSTSSGAAFPMASPQHVSIGGVFQLGVYVATAVLAGAGMILL